jgi:hypothetical protein
MSKKSRQRFLVDRLRWTTHDARKLSEALAQVEALLGGSKQSQTVWGYAVKETEKEGHDRLLEAYGGYGRYAKIENELTPEQSQQIDELIQSILDMRKPTKPETPKTIWNHEVKN